MGVFAQPVPPTVLQFAALRTGYLSLASAMLGDTATPGDGFDAALLGTVVQTPSADAGVAASDAAFNALVDAFAGFYDSGIDDLASELGSHTAALDVPENVFTGAVQGLGSPLNLPPTPSDVSIPNFNVSTGIPALPAPPNPPVTTPPAPPVGGVAGPPPIVPPYNAPFPGRCTIDIGGTSINYLPGTQGAPCVDIWGFPADCPCLPYIEPE